MHLQTIQKHNEKKSNNVNDMQIQKKGGTETIKHKMMKRLLTFSHGFRAKFKNTLYSNNNFVLQQCCNPISSQFNAMHL